MPTGHLRGHPKMEQAIGFPVTGIPAGGAYGPCWEMSQHDEHDLPGRNLKYNPTGGRNWDGLAINESAGHTCTQATVNNLL